MCLGIPMEVVSVDETEKTAEVELGGTKQQVRLDVINEMPKVGDYVIVHAGFAIYRLDKAEAEKTLSLFEEILSHEQAEIH
ncbi:MAG: HypC/HybG/HupF family hydrogenase formation chaperone [Candidatus Desulfofervidaceae bacterium]|nr:HypC/HybG/HupF family hydrogenase formation chaperone [Candidatus Desulfofervidaceae bacterium]MDL1969790.1 HypC/HybG/HupF family hydrogenase formation chaperone [Candidatus Desulfofervidaceae bacterium]